MAIQVRRETKKHEVCHSWATAMEKREKGALSGEDGGIMQVQKLPLGQEGSCGHLCRRVCFCVYYMDIYYRKPWSFTLNNFTVPNRLIAPVTWKMPGVLIQVLLTFGRRIWSERSEGEVVVESWLRGVWGCGTVHWRHPLSSRLDFKLCAVDPVSRVFWHSPLQGRSHSLGPFTFGCLGKQPPFTPYVVLRVEWVASPPSTAPLPPILSVK